jgi:hypothetical protein
MLRAAADNGTLRAATRPERLLFDWSRLQPDGSGEVIAFTTEAMQDDTKLCQLACAFLGKSYSHEIGGFGGAPGDLVHRENDRAQIDGIDRLLDVDVFRGRLTASTSQLLRSCRNADRDRHKAVAINTTS